MTTETSARRVIADYFSLSPLSCWRWQEDGGVVEWSEGGTVAFLQEISGLVLELAPDGLPPLELLLCLLDRCRQRRPPLRTVMDRMLLSARLVGCEASQSAEQLRPGLPALDPTFDDSSASLAEKCHLIRLLLDSLPADCRFYSPEQAALVVRGIVEGIERHTDAAPPGLEMRRWQLTFDALQHLVARLAAADVELTKRTGLDAPVQRAGLEVPPFERFRHFLDELEADSELGGVALLARELMAAVHIPRPVSHSHELPVGGVSDICNRGPLDRLLLSELANDDLTLAVRVALNEALYLRRETPPRLPRGHRVVLLDAGIRMWGTPRVFATAAALALGAMADGQGALEAYRARAGEIVPVDLTTKEGLIAHLGALETETHPGDALAAFFDAVQGLGALCDAILITHPACLADSKFCRRLDVFDRQVLHCATVTTDGGFQLLRRTRGSWVTVRQADLEVDKILSRPARQGHPQPLLGPNITSELPLFFGVDPAPLLMPADYAAGHVCEHPRYGVVAVTKLRQLLIWTRRDRGGRQLMPCIPHGEVDWIDLDENGVVRLLLRHLKQHRVVSFDLNTRQVTQVELEGGARQPLFVTHDESALILRHAGRVDVYDLVTGGRLVSQNIREGSQRYHNRYIIESDRVCTIAWDGSNLRIEPVEHIRWPRPLETVLAVFDRPGLDGPWLVTFDGEVLCTADEKPVSIAQPGRLLSVRGISRDGRRLWVEPRPVAGRRFDPQHSRVRLEGAVSCKWEWLSDANFLAGDLMRSHHQSDLHRGWLGAGIAPDGRLLLAARRNIAWHVAWDPRRGLTLENAHMRGDFLPRFQRIPSSLRKQAGVLLWSTLQPGKSRIFLDSRGLLHLKSGDPAIPETTLVLSHATPLAAWCSDGSTCGPEFFFDGPHTSNPAAVFENIKRFIRGCV